MISEQIIEGIFFTVVTLTGFYAGTGFFVAMGGNAAIKLMSDRTFAEYWQHTDYYMAARMKIFGPLLLVVLLLSVLVLFKEYNSISFWFMLVALGIMLTDVVFTLSTNHPLNRRVQSWDLDNLPSNVKEIQGQIIRAFSIRIIFMISTFIMVLLSVWMHKVR